MIAQISSPADSISIFQAIQQFFPGIAPGFVALIAGIGASRLLWLVKLLGGLLPVIFDIPAVHKVVDVVQNFWKNFAWIINPILMIVTSYLVTHHWDRAALIAFAGIGVREWLIKSPIPTSKAELDKLKGALILGAIFLLSVVPSTSSAVTLSKAFVPSDPNANAVTLAKELVAEEWKTLPSNISITMIKKEKYEFYEHVKLSLNGGYGWDGGDPYPWLGLRPAYIINGKWSLQYDVYDNFKTKDLNHRVGINFLIF